MSLAAHDALLTSRIRGRNAVVSIVGLGYGGLPLAPRFSKVRFNVVGMDNHAVFLQTAANLVKA
jgi:UDP-N-acetyl-D-mannosaminuronate dehydrogenase